MDHSKKSSHSRPCEASLTEISLLHLLVRCARTPRLHSGWVDHCRRQAKLRPRFDREEDDDDHILYISLFTSPSSPTTMAKTPIIKGVALDHREDICDTIITTTAFHGCKRRQLQLKTQEQTTTSTSPSTKEPSRTYLASPPSRASTKGCRQLLIYLLPRQRLAWPQRRPRHCWHPTSPPLSSHPPSAMTDHREPPSSGSEATTAAATRAKVEDEDVKGELSLPFRISLRYSTTSILRYEMTCENGLTGQVG